MNPRHNIRVQMMRDCTRLATEHKDLIDKYEETGEQPYWAEFLYYVRHEGKCTKPTEGYWILEHNKATIELRFIKCIYGKKEAEDFLQWFKHIRSKNHQSRSDITLEGLPYGELPQRKTSSAS